LEHIIDSISCWKNTQLIIRTCKAMDYVTIWKNRFVVSGDQSKVISKLFYYFSLRMARSNSWNMTIHSNRTLWNRIKKPNKKRHIFWATWLSVIIRKHSFNYHNNKNLRPNHHQYSHVGDIIFLGWKNFVVWAKIVWKHQQVLWI